MGDESTNPSPLLQAVLDTLAGTIALFPFQRVAPGIAPKLRSALAPLLDSSGEYYYCDQAAPGDDYETHVSSSVMAFYNQYGDDYLTLLKATARLTQ